jgi:hypothetical protein
MKFRNLTRAAAALAAAAALGACNNWLTSSDAASNPNVPTAASIDQLFVGAQTTLTLEYTSDLARTACLFVQQCAGTDRQYKQLGVYSYSEDAYDVPFEDVYTGGGLIDIRKMEALADESSDQIYGGIARVLEAMEVGLAADMWGDVPFSEAVSDVVKPKLDPQEEVYAAVQAKLDTAITMLATGQGKGPGGQDLYYGGDAAKWGRLAHTLKARFYLHVEEKVGQSAYASALSEAQQGLQQGDDFLGIAAANPQSNNLWYQFIVIQRAGYLMAGQRLVDLLKANNDPRLQKYFSAAGNGQFAGAPPNTQGDATTISDLNQSTRVTADFRQPIVTYAENQLIIAEAALQTGNSALALQAYNAERTSEGVPTAGSVTLADIMTEKYIALFQNIESWNDYKRTCLPALTPAAGAPAIPGRLLYPSAETTTNPNFPTPAEQPARNWNDPNACPAA